MFRHGNATVQLLVVFLMGVSIKLSYKPGPVTGLVQVQLLLYMWTGS
jgi:hypothetical protein